MEKKMNGAERILNFPHGEENQGIYRVKKDAKVKYVDYRIFVPKVFAIALILPTRKNISNKNFEKNFDNAKTYFRNVKSSKVLDIIDFENGKDKKMWLGTLKNKSDFICICKNYVKTKDSSFYQLSYINYDKDTKEIFQDYVSKNNEGTVNNFVSSDYYKNFLDYTERNIRKCLYSFSIRMGFNISRTNAYKSVPVKESLFGKPKTIKLEHIWTLNSFEKIKNELYCFHNCISVPNKGHLIKLRENNQIEIVNINLPNKHRNYVLKAYQTFAVSPGITDIFNLEAKNRNVIYSMNEEDTLEVLDIKPVEKFTSAVKSVKLLVKSLNI